MFGLAPGQNWWPGGAAKTDAFSDGGRYRFMLTSGLPAVVAVNSMGADELTLEVVLNPKIPDTDPGEVYGLSGGDEQGCGHATRMSIHCQAKQAHGPFHFAPQPNLAFNRDAHAAHGRPLTLALGFLKTRALPGR